MKISCILTSFNRPKWIQQALHSVMVQTYRDYELIIIDESTEFDIHSVLVGFKFPHLSLVRYQVSEEVRDRTNRLSINVNKGLRLATGDLICFLADDDFLYPTWFADAVEFFKKNPSVGAGFGRLFYTRLAAMEHPDDKTASCRFFNRVIVDPCNKLDHNQIIHRPTPTLVEWPEEIEAFTAPDGLYARKVARHYPFHPIYANAAVKRLHGKNLQDSKNGPVGLGGLRE